MPLQGRWLLHMTTAECAQKQAKAHAYAVLCMTVSVLGIKVFPPAGMVVQAELENPPHTRKSGVTARATGRQCKLAEMGVKRSKSQNNSQIWFSGGREPVAHGINTAFWRGGSKTQFVCTIKAQVICHAPMMA